eukprot:NODE_92_length_21718_cov_0.361950.p10 type:complete len:161 gc:universal NODE_92_length_21718_cov_0.361950:20295-19813(-)
MPLPNISLALFSSSSFSFLTIKSFQNSLSPLSNFSFICSLSFTSISNFMAWTGVMVLNASSSSLISSSVASILLLSKHSRNSSSVSLICASSSTFSNICLLPCLIIASISVEFKSSALSSGLTNSLFNVDFFVAITNLRSSTVLVVTSLIAKTLFTCPIL